MKKVLLHALMCALLAAGLSRAEEVKKPAEAPKEAPKLDLKSDKEIASYALGLNFGMSAKQFADELDIDAMAASFRDSMAGKESKLSDEDMSKSFVQFKEFMTKKKSGDKTATLANKSNVSTAIGRNMGHRLSFVGDALIPELAATGFTNGAKGETGGFDVNANRPVIEKYLKGIQDDMAAKAKELGVKNQKECDEFMAENKKKDGVTVTASGLQYKILTAGKGDIPKAGDTVNAKYEGRFLDGKVFDSTAKHGTPFDSFPVMGVIPGWTEALKLMPTGSKWELYIPGNLAYGEQGNPPEIPASKMLIFTLDLVSIQKAETPPPAGLPTLPTAPKETK